MNISTNNTRFESLHSIVGYGTAMTPAHLIAAVRYLAFQPRKIFWKLGLKMEEYLKGKQLLRILNKIRDLYRLEPAWLINFDVKILSRFLVKGTEPNTIFEFLAKEIMLLRSGVEQRGDNSRLNFRMDIK